MIGKKSIFAGIAVLVLAYAATPYIALWRLATALREGDSRTLEALIDWDAVRGGLKQDVAEGIVGLPDDEPESLANKADATSGEATAQLASGTLPPFGASFMTGIAGTMIDREVTPQHLVVLMRQLAPAEPTAIGPITMAHALGGIEHAFFDSPTSFTLRMHCAGQDADDPPLRVRLEMHNATWRVVRAWIPQDLIELANSRT
jgi:hypothetical protein